MATKRKPVLHKSQPAYSLIYLYFPCLGSCFTLQGTKGEPKEVAEKMNLRDILVSLSHCSDYAIAQVILVLDGSDSLKPLNKIVAKLSEDGKGNAPKQSGRKISLWWRRGRVELPVQRKSIPDMLQA